MPGLSVSSHRAFITSYALRRKIILAFSSVSVQTFGICLNASVDREHFKKKNVSGFSNVSGLI